MVGVVVLEFAVVPVEDGVDFCGGGFLTAAGFFFTLVFCPDELIIRILGRESVKFFGCEILQEVVRAGDLLEPEIAFLAGNIRVQFFGEPAESCANIFLRRSGSQAESPQS